MQPSQKQSETLALLSKDKKERQVQKEQWELVLHCYLEAKPHLVTHRWVNLGETTYLHLIDVQTSIPIHCYTTTIMHYFQVLSHPSISHRMIISSHFTIKKNCICLYPFSILLKGCEDWSLSQHAIGKRQCKAWAVHPQAGRGTQPAQTQVEEYISFWKKQNKRKCRFYWHCQSSIIFCHLFGNAECLQSR